MSRGFSLQTRDRIRLWGKGTLFPGLDVQTRYRYRFLRYFKGRPIGSLDAGCTGAISYAAHQRGNRVRGSTMEPDQVQKNSEYFSFLGTNPGGSNLKSAIHAILTRSREGLTKSSARRPWNTSRERVETAGLQAGQPVGRLVLPKRFDTWSLTSLQRRLVKTGGRLIQHARFYSLPLAESHLTRRLFDQMLRRIWALPMPSG
jgi:hypothetical protein